MRDWFRYGSMWHLVAEGKRAECGLELLEVPEMVSADPDDMPPDPCRSCMVVWLRDEVEDEPLGAAIGRGYIEVDPLD